MQRLWWHLFMALLLAMETGMCVSWHYHAITSLTHSLHSHLLLHVYSSHFMILDDIVRADTILAMIQEDSKATTRYEDIQVRKGNPKRGWIIHMRGTFRTHMMASKVLLNICVARKTNDHRSLQHKMYYQVAHLALLLDVTDAELLLRQEVDEVKRNQLVDRIQSLLVIAA